jgi:predicted ABC-type ATPase
MADAPQVIVIGNPNGAGKTTAARGILAPILGIAEFVNADTIAAGLAVRHADRAAFAAGRIMLRRLHELAEARAHFAFETTMASRSFLPWLRGLSRQGYEVNAIFVWLSSPALAIRRVRARVQTGGHGVPAQTIRRRYRRGAVNVIGGYLPLATRWRVYDNSLDGTDPRAIAMGAGDAPVVFEAAVWQRLLREAARAQVPGETDR